MPEADARPAERPGDRPTDDAHREHKAVDAVSGGAGARRLDRLLRPRSIAVFGAQPAMRVIEQCDRLGFDGPIWPVHPTRDTLGSRPCVRSVAELPGVPDAAYIAVNRALTVDVVRDLAQLGCGGAVCYAAGFDEVTRDDTGVASGLQARLVEAADAMPIVGPNCYGFVNVPARVALWPDQHGAAPCERGVALITQSSNVAISLTMQTRALPVAWVLTAGNQAQTGLSELAMAALEDDAITVLGLHIEGLDDRTSFERVAARARELGKPVVVLKVGTSEYARRAAMTHTASLAGSSAVFDAFARRLGVAVVDSLEVFLETLKLLHVVGPLAGDRVLSLSCSGGEAALMADALDRRALATPPIPDALVPELQDAAGEVVTVSNPFDYNTFIWGDWPRMTRLYAGAMRVPVDLAALVLDFPRADRCDTADWDHALDAWLAAVEQTGARTAVVATLGENLPEAVAARLVTHGVAPLLGIDSAVAAIAAAAQLGAAWQRTPPPVAARFQAVDTTRPDPLDEHRSKRLLASRGAPVPAGVVVTEATDLDAVVARLGGGPVALKALGVAHKTEAGAVRLGLGDAPAVVSARDAMPSPTGCWLVERMVDAPVLAELLVGVTRDPVLGPALTVGAGGIHTELLADTRTCVLPASAEDVRAALDGLRVRPLLDGFRGRPAADVDAIVDAVLAIASVALNEPVIELDVNPLLVTTTGCVAVDALVVLDASSAERG